VFFLTYLRRELHRRMRQSWPARTSHPSLMPLRVQNRLAGCAAALAATMSLLLAACGSGTPSAAQSTTTKPTPAASAATAGSRSAFCNISRRFWADRLLVARSEEKNMPNMSPGDMPSGKRPSRQAALRATRDMQAALPELEASAPAGRQAAVRAIVNGEKPFFAAIVQANGDLTKLPPTAMASSMSVLNTPQGKAMVRYWSQTCEIAGLGRITSSEHQ
jgi:hypothetical protein